jgi:hypothetical protein
MISTFYNNVSKLSNKVFDFRSTHFLFVAMPIVFLGCRQLLSHSHNYQTMFSLVKHKFDTKKVIFCEIRLFFFTQPWLKSGTLLICF